MLKVVILGSLVLATSTLPARAQSGLPDPAHVADALDMHPSVQAAEARTSAAKADADALARGAHELTFSAGYVRRSVDREGQYDEYDATLSRPVRLPGKARIDREIGSAGIDAASNQAEDVRHQAALLLSQYWWDWVGAAEEARVDRQAVENYDRMLTATKRRVAMRDAALLEADQAEGALSTAQVAAENSAGRERVARTRLLAQFPNLPLPDVAPEVPLPEFDESRAADLGRKVVSRSHEIAAAEALAKKAAASAARARSERIADPSLGVRLFSERDGAERGAGVVLSMPLGGGHRRALADRSTAEAGAARAEAMAARFMVDEMASTDVADARFRYNAWKRAREAVAAQVAALTKLRMGQAAGEFGLADVLLTERQVHEAFRTEVVARTDAQRALTRLQIDSHELWITE